MRSFSGNAKMPVMVVMERVVCVAVSALTVAARDTVIKALSNKKSMGDKNATNISDDPDRIFGVWENNAAASYPQCRSWL
ncbi:hypothetical protein XSR1_190059 [Xenorhabdus szentirmaii DSM 16338]|uniref:Uncharacterized protein n=1 Tax=Xenorhabdus szentirmaii DSM 16338 TaxID=1427518 RepID=W1IUF6_9GAMM|nr:hypothetical protein XSR1_190059 [Xenorhabdus szentirmaii DSM 16338]